MGFQRRPVALAAVASAMILAIAAAVVAVAAPGSPHHPVPGHEVASGVVASVERPAGSNAGAVVASPATKITYQGSLAGRPGVAEGAPRVYLVYWGTQWGLPGVDSRGDWTFGDDLAGLAPYQQEFFKGLGTNGETWSGVVTQYCGGVAAGATSCAATATAHVGYPAGGALAGIWYDDSAPAPARATRGEIEREAIAAAEHFGNDYPSANSDSQYVITSPPGTDPGGWGGGNGGVPSFCAWHASVTSLRWGRDEVAYTNMPYLPQAGRWCGATEGSADGKPGALAGVSIVGGHEYAETLTDMNGRGWLAASGSGDGDRCGLDAGAAVTRVRLSTGTFPVPAVWANDGNGGRGACELSHPVVTDPPASRSGPKILIVGDSISNGMAGDYTWRYRLWQDFQASGTHVRFVGHRTGTDDMYDDPADLAVVNAESPPADGYANPTDGSYNQAVRGTFAGAGVTNHDSLWGWSYYAAVKYIAGEVGTYRPDYLLIELGFNDLAFGRSPAAVLADAKALIDAARVVRPALKVLVATVVHRTPVPGYPRLNATITTYNTLLPAAARQWATARSPVHVADISAGYKPRTDSYDGVHPNSPGEYQIANAFATALARDYGLGDVPGPPPRHLPGITLTTPKSLTVTASATGLLLQWSRVAGASGYKIFARDVTGDPSPAPAFGELALPAPGDHWFAPAGPPGHTYQYEVAAAHGWAQSAPSAAVTITMAAR